MIGTEENRLNVVYCGNEKVFPLILLSALSVARYTPRPVSFYIVTMDLTEVDPRYLPVTEEERSVLETAVRAHTAGNTATLLRADGLYETYFRGGKNEGSSYTPYTFLRLLLSEFDAFDRAVYLDADTMCCSDLSAFEEYDISSYEFAAALDHMGKFWIRRDYINAGVVYFNLKKIRETGLFVRARETLFRKKMYFSDQTVLNRYGRKGKLLLPRRFNEQRGIREDTVVKHFCRGIRWLPFFKVYNYKQNDVKNVHGKLHITYFDDVYAEYDRLAEEYGLPPLKK